jgi:RNA polymerase sigma factor (sigma-70 family)
MSAVRDDEWPTLLERLDFPDPDGRPSEEDIWMEIRRRLRILAAINRLARFGLTYEDTEDVVQNVLMSLHQQPTRRDAIRAAKTPHAFVMRVLRNAAIDFVRKNKIERQLSTDSVEIALPTASIAWNDLVEELGDDERKILEMRYREEKSLGEIAQALGISYSAAASRIFRLLARLRAQRDIED